MRRLAFTIIMIGAGLSLAPGLASAQPRRHARLVHRVRTVEARVAETAPPLTVRPRSYLDPGNVVPEGSQNQYVWIPSRPHNDLYYTGGLGWRYGAGTLPDTFTAPGRPVNLLDYDLDYPPAGSY
jgi:hypothetical protein